MADTPRTLPTTVAAAPRVRWGHVAATVAKYAFLGFWAALCVLPMVLVVSTAVKDPTFATGDPFKLFSSINFANFETAWTLGNFGRYFVNTIVIMVPTVIGVI